MIHKIKALYDEGRGSSIRAIAQELKISRNTVRKYLAMTEEVITAYQERKGRTKRLDVHRAYIVHLLETYPKLSAVKVLRKLQEAHGELSVSARSIRRYIEALRRAITPKQVRYYEPVLDMAPGVQCQVDGGGLRGVVIGGVETTIYLTVFVLSYSRLMYVAVSVQPIDTATFIGQHDAAFRYFGGRPRECVYDQTKLVVLQEAFRELVVNEAFARYATTVGFRLRVCEGYDPESKGKVEAAVKYVKSDGLYGERFATWAELVGYLAQWLEETANARVHAATLEVPRQRYDTKERAAMLPYLTPVGLDALGARDTETRRADKTGLIAYQGNKYSVPLAYQRSRVGVSTAQGQLLIHNLETDQVVAHHTLAYGKGQIVRNTDHYRDHSQRISDLETAIAGQVGEGLGARLCALIKASEPRIYKDQLRGVLCLLKAHAPVDAALIAALCDRPRLSATLLRDLLEARRINGERALTTDEPAAAPTHTPGSLARYGDISADNREVQS